MKADVRRALEALSVNGKTLDPYSVVEAARDPDHPLHERFTWDNTEAAERWRLAEARALIREVTVVRHISKRRTVEVVAWVRNPEMPPRVAGYVSIDQVRAQSSLALSVMDGELARAKAAIQRAKSVAAVLGISRELDQLQVDLDELFDLVRTRKAA